MINKNQLKVSFLLAMICLLVKVCMDNLDKGSMASKFIQTINIIGASGYWYLPIIVGGWFVIVFTFGFYIFFRVLNAIVHALYRRR
ncbi:hypothetical protein [Periweissella ghanensis]|uniref:Uncharacterized protein n=1 Tax=Periweissella ghanensis TaxID=467997 RepID=A0ABM8ZAD8_9LACO|nr:hypothetical protein [Periweissella ghanensis]MCM0600915.1 hypothetical protein [Periweissella ghanensis]CAH0417667.1 hypothetical protein WGH24286_00079 [Periweissella ghanensis]